MASAEVAAFVELGRWCALPDDTEVYVSSTKNPRRFHLKKRPREKRASKVKHRRHESRNLTESQESDTD